MSSLEEIFVLASRHLAAGNPRLAEVLYRQIIQVAPHFAVPHNCLGVALIQQGQLDHGIASFHQALARQPNYAEAHVNLGSALKDQGKLDESVASYRRGLLLKPDFAEGHSNLLYALLFCPGYDAPAISEEHRNWDRLHAAPLTKRIRQHPNSRVADRRLRVGYVSPYCREHVIGRNLLPLFREHDHQQFEIVCYAQVQDPDWLTKSLQDCADVWRNIVNLSHEQLDQLVHEDRIDILVDLTLHMANNRLLVFARKPAPVQVTFAGYPGTTGLAAIDYRLTDPFLDPPGQDDSLYAEQSIRLPDSFWCYDPLTDEPAVNILPAIGNGFVTFGCLNNFCKVNPLVIKLWAQVLKATDRSQIIMRSPEGAHRQHTLGLLGQEGITADRVTFCVDQPHHEYMELYHRIDIGLDTFPYNGHYTSLDSYWMGVPVITLVGQTVVGRAGLCQLSNLGLMDLIAHTPEQFVSIALELAKEMPRLQNLRTTMRKRLQQSPLMDARRFARNIEAAYRGMWQRWCAS